MKMGTTKPTEPGYYWAENNYAAYEGSFICGDREIVQVVLREGGARARIIGSYFTLPMERWVRWSERIAEPEVEG